MNPIAGSVCFCSIFYLVFVVVVVVVSSIILVSLLWDVVVVVGIIELLSGVEGVGLTVSTEIVVVVLTLGSLVSLISLGMLRSHESLVSLEALESHVTLALILGHTTIVVVAHVSTDALTPGYAVAQAALIFVLKGSRSELEYSMIIWKVLFGTNLHFIVILGVVAGFFAGTGALVVVLKFLVALQIGVRSIGGRVGIVRDSSSWVKSEVSTGKGAEKSQKNHSSVHFACTFRNAITSMMPYQTGVHYL